MVIILIKNSQCISVLAPTLSLITFYPIKLTSLSSIDSHFISLCHIEMESIRRNRSKQLGSHSVFNNHMQRGLPILSFQNIIEDEIPGMLVSTLFNTRLPWSTKKYFAACEQSFLNWVPWDTRTLFICEFENQIQNA